MINTYSAFNYGHTITELNRSIDFDEGNGPLIAQLAIGAYSLGDFVSQLSIALNEAGEEDYTVTLDRATRLITIASTASFDLLVTGGQTNTVSAFPLAGFTVSGTGQNSYTGTLPSGLAFFPQVLLQDYVDFEDFQEASDSVVNESSSGNIETVSFGKNKFMECEIKYQHNDPAGNSPKWRRNDPAGVDNLRDFMVYATTKAPLEFIKDVNTPDTFVKCILDSAPSSRNGTGFRLREDRQFQGYFNSGKLKFRERTL